MRARASPAAFCFGAGGAIVNIKFIPLTALIRVSLPFAGNAQGTIRSANEGAAAGEKAAEQFAHC